MPVTRVKSNDQQFKSIESSNDKMLFENKKALLVDDDMIVLTILKKTFLRMGFEVISTIDSNEAVAMVKDAKPDVVFTDIHMPGLSGFELTSEIRGFDEGIPVFGMTSGVKPELEEECNRVGMNALVDKGSSVHELKLLVDDFLNK